MIDSHLHLWDPTLFSYPWLAGNELLDRPYLLDDYRAETAGLSVESMVFVQCEASPIHAEDEVAWVAKLAEGEPRIRGVVAWAALERGGAVRKDLERLSAHRLLRGIRRIIQFEDDPCFCLRPDFLEGLRALAEYDLSFDICIAPTQLRNALQMAAAVPGVPMVLDHLAKPFIRDGLIEPWASDLRAIATLPNVYCKISGVATEAAHAAWVEDDLRRYIDIAIDAFGFDRVMFGGDWPVSIQAISFKAWVSLLEKVLAGASEQERLQFWSQNAANFYRLEGELN